MPELAIVPESLWSAVAAIQSSPVAATGRGLPRAVAAGDKRKGYWLSSLLACGECGSNYVAYGAERYICSGHISGSCDNRLHFSRDKTHERMAKVLETELLSDARMEQAASMWEADLRQREQAARKASVAAVDTRAIDKQIAQVRKMGLPDAAMAAALRELERDRRALLDSGKALERFALERKHLAALPDFRAKFSTALRRVLTSNADVAQMQRAREMTRAVIEGGRVVLAPVAAGDMVDGVVPLRGLASLALGPVAAVERVARPQGKYKAQSRLPVRYAI